MKILASGGTGFIDSTVIFHIINNTLDAVVSLDKLTRKGQCY